MRTTGIGSIGRAFALLTFGAAALLGCGDNGVVEAPTDITLDVSPSTVTVTEGASATFTVTTNAEPTFSGVINVATEDPSKATVSPAVIPFQPGAQSPVTITVTGVQDDDLGNETTRVVLSSSGFSTTIVDVNVTDDDAQALVLSSNAISMNEGGAASFTAHLAFQPAADTVITVASDDTVRLGAAPATLTFTAANYGTDQTVSLAAAEDADTTANQVAVALTSGTLAGTVNVSITDNDVQGITVTPASVAVSEATPATVATFQVTLNQQPTADVTLTLTNPDSSSVDAVAAQGSSLVFTSANYNNGAVHTINVNAIDDGDTVSETVLLSIGGTGLTSRTVTVNVTDDDVQALEFQNVATGDIVTLGEGTTLTNVAVRLAFNPGADVNVLVTPSNTAIAGVSPTVVSFTSSNFNTFQALSINAPQDADTADNSSSLTFTSGVIATRTVTVNVIDDDSQTIVLSYAGAPGTLVIPEGQGVTPSQSVVNVTLGFQPAADTTVMIGSNNPDVLLSTTTLTFTANDYNQPHPVTITARDEALGIEDSIDDTALIVFGIVGGPTRNLNVSVPDTDVPSFIVQPATLPTVDEGQSTTFTVRLSIAPASPVSVTITSSSTKATFAGQQTTTITIPTSNNPVSVTVDAVDDADAADESVTLTLHDNTVNTVIPDRALGLSINDLDTMAFVVTPGQGLPTPNLDSDTNRAPIVEGGSDITFTVGLTAAPTGDFTVTVAPGQTDAVTVSNNGTVFAATTTLTFTPTDFAAKTITVRAPQDLNLVDEIFGIRISGPAQLGAPDAFFFIRKVEDDLQAIVTNPVHTGTLIVTEGTPGQISVRMLFQPTMTVPVTLTQTNPNAPNPPNILLSAVNDLDPGFGVQLTFTTTNWNEEQIVTVSTDDDDDQVDDISGTVTVASNGLANRVINIDLRDNDTQAIVTTVGGNPASSLTIGEPTGGMTTMGSFNLRLAFIPTQATETITVTVPASDTARLALCDSAFNNCQSSRTYAFGQSGGNAWNLAQTVYFRSSDDADLISQQVQLALASDLPEAADRTFTVTITDDDAQNLAVDQTVFALFENPMLLKQDTVGISLTQDPTTPFTVTVTSPSPADVSVSADGTTFGATATLTFTTTGGASPWNVDQQVFIRAENDPDVRPESVTLTVAGTGIPSVTIAVSVVDDDQQAFVVSPTTANGGLLINEGASGNFNVSLQFEPTANVTVVVSRDVIAAQQGTIGAGNQVTLNGSATATLTFTPANYSVAQAVAVAAPEDNADLDHFNGNLFVDATSVQNAAETPADAASIYAVRDNDTQGITITSVPAGVRNSAQEGGPYVEFDVALTTRPRVALSDSVQLTPPSSTGALPSVEFFTGNGDDGSTTTSLTLTFTAADFATPQRVRWVIRDVFADDATNYGVAPTTRAISLTTVGEASDQAPAAGFMASNSNAVASQAIFGVDSDLQVVIAALDRPTGYNGATQFNQRRNVAFGWDGVSAHGNVAFTARTQPNGGDVFLNFTDRTIAAATDGPVVGTGGGPVSTEFIEFDPDSDGAGPDVASWNVFTTSNQGILYARYTLTGTTLLAPIQVVVSGDAPTDFAAARNLRDGVYGVIYRRAQDGLQNLYFRTVNVTTGAVSSEVISTNATAAQHLHPVLMYVGPASNAFPHPTFNTVAAPYVVLYNEALVNKMVRLTATGAPLGSFTFDIGFFPGQNFANAIFVPSGSITSTLYGYFGSPGVVWATNVRETGPGQGENAVTLYGLILQSSGQVSFNGGPVITLTQTPLEPISPPAIALNVQEDGFYGDFAVAYDSSLGADGTTIANQVGVALYNWSTGSGARDFRLQDSADTGLFPSITWGLDRWVLRYQADNQSATGLRLRTGSFEGSAVGSGSNPNRTASDVFEIAPRSGKRAAN